MRATLSRSDWANHSIKASCVDRLILAYDACPSRIISILAQAERSARAVILGASFIGMEVAASLSERGLDVTVIGREAVPFEKQLGREVGAALVGLHAKRGVAFRAASRAAARARTRDANTGP